jgi:hypothetical protein
MFEINVRIWKWIGLVALVVSMVCVISYAEKGDAKSITLPDAVKNAIQKAYLNVAILVQLDS